MGTARVQTFAEVHAHVVAVRNGTAGNERVVLVARRFAPPGILALGPGAQHYVEILQHFQREGPPPKPWRPTAREQGRRKLAETIGRELAYGHVVMSDDESLAIVDEFLGLFSEEAEYLGVSSHERMSMEAQFDSGLVVRDRTRIALLWFESDSPGR